MTVKANGAPEEKNKEVFFVVVVLGTDEDFELSVETCCMILCKMNVLI